MRSVSPRIGDADEFTIAEEQLEFKPVVACLAEFADGTISRVLRYTFNELERDAIAHGKDPYFGTPADQLLQPHWFSVGWPPKEGT